MFKKEKRSTAKTGKDEAKAQHRAKSMAGVAQLVRASVCGTECRQFESGRPPHKIHPHQNGGG